MHAADVNGYVDVTCKNAVCWWLCLFHSFHQTTSSQELLPGILSSGVQYQISPERRGAKWVPQDLHGNGIRFWGAWASLNKDKSFFSWLNIDKITLVKLCFYLFLKECMCWNSYTTLRSYNMYVLKWQYCSHVTWHSDILLVLNQNGESHWIWEHNPSFLSNNVGNDLPGDFFSVL